MKNKETLEDRFCNNCNNDVCCCIIRTQETLEEVAERLLNLNELDSFRDYHYKQELYNAFIVGIKYQQKISYSEEEVLVLLHKRDAYNFEANTKSLQEWETPKEWFEQFKNK